MSRPALASAWNWEDPGRSIKSFWQAHGIEHLGKLFSPEAQVTPGETLWVPLTIRNDSDAERQVTLHSTCPRAGAAAESHDVYGGRAQFLSDSAHDQQFSRAQGNLANIDLDGGQWWPKPREVTLRVDVVSNGLPRKRLVPVFK